MTETIQAPGPIPPDASPLAAPRVPQIEYPPKFMLAPSDVCDECSNTGHPFAGYFGGVTRFHDGCSACGREGES